MSSKYDAMEWLVVAISSPVGVGLVEAVKNYGIGKVTSSVADVVLDPIIRRVKVRLGLSSADPGQAVNGLVEQHSVELERIVDYADCLEERVATLERNGEVSGDDLCRRASAPSVANMIARGADAATETGRPEAPVILAELVCARLRYEEDTSEARALQRAIEIAAQLSTDELLLLGGLVVVNTPSAFRDVISEFGRTRNLSVLEEWLGGALPALFPTTPTVTRLIDLESLGLVTRSNLQRAGEPMQHQSPIEQLVTVMVGAIPTMSAEPIRDFIPGMPPDSNCYRAARLAVPSSDGVQVSQSAPILMNYDLTSVGRRIAESVIRGSLGVEVHLG